MKRFIVWFAWTALSLLAGAALMATFQSASAQSVCPTSIVAPDAARVCWRNATVNVDGSAIAATGPGALKETIVRRSICAADGTFGALIETVTVTADVGYLLFENLPPAVHCFQARHSNNAGELSGWSAIARKTTTAPPPPRPKAPGSVLAS